MDLREAMTSGVLVEFVDASGRVVGQVVFSPWRSRPLPGVGDRVAYTAQTASGKKSRLTGTVRSRHFDVQQDADGEPSVWARLEVLTSEKRRPRGWPARSEITRQWFSDN